MYIQPTTMEILVPGGMQVEILSIGMYARRIITDVTNLRAQVATLNRSCGHSTPLTGISVLKSKELHLLVVPHHEHLNSTLVP